MIDRTIAGLGCALFAALALWSVTGCSPAQQAGVNTALDTPTGQLFCRIQTGGGGALVVAVVDAGAVALTGPAAPLAVIATGASKSFVDNACAEAAKALAVSPANAQPVPPPADPAAAPKVAVKVPVA
jgi:hypothetical protein